MKLGPILILIGVIFLGSANYTVQSVDTEVGIKVFNEIQWWQFWIPRSYQIIQVPDYTLNHLIIGTASLTTGIITTIKTKKQ